MIVEHIGHYILFLQLFLMVSVVNAQDDSVIIDKSCYKLFDNGIFEITGKNGFDTNITWISTMGIWGYAGGDTIALKSYEKYRSTLYSAREYVDTNSDDIVFEIYDTAGNLLTINRCKDLNHCSSFQYDYECDTCLFIGATIYGTNTDYIILSLKNRPLYYKICDKQSNHFMFVVRDACDNQSVYINALYKECERGLLFIKNND